MPKKKKETTLDDVLKAVRDGFGDFDNKFQEMDRKLDRIEKIVNKWPPPSEIDRLFRRVNRVERILHLKPLPK